MVKITYASAHKCCVCKKGLKNIRNISRVGEKTIEKVREISENSLIRINDYICGRCRQNILRNKHTAKLDISVNNDNSLSEFDRSISPTNSKEEPNIQFSEDTKQTEKILLDTVISSHRYCFICKDKKRLHKIKKESIICAYKNYGIVIKEDSRCCNMHLDSKGLIKLEEFFKIPKRSKTYDKDAIKLVDICLSYSEHIQYQLEFASGIFDKFKDMASLDEHECFKITGWTKVQLNEFSKLITNVKDTAGRTKEQLIAIYRFWLAKGIDQSSLAMFKSNTNQQQISHYLSQARSAINKEFVPLFLGANKGKEFFLKHNTESVKVLHDFKDNTLAVIADGTYTRLEKSANNDFQYLSYSMQKSQNLVKPFIMCCADGYFIDCYGPFSANLNDARILRYVLDADEHLSVLFKEKHEIVFFLDRGM